MSIARGLRAAALLTAIALVASACRGSVAPPPSLPPTGGLGRRPETVVSSADPDRAVIYLARDRLPPVARRVAGAGAGASAPDRIGSRVAALLALSSGDWDESLTNVAATTPARVASVAVVGDLARVDFTVPEEGWGIDGASRLRAFIQQLVYTASEEPGIARVLLTENGRTAVIGGEGLVIDRPATRESVGGYGDAFTEPLRFEGETVAASGRLEVTSELVASALVRAAVTLERAAGKEQWTPSFTVRVERNDERASPERGKWLLTLDVPGASGSPESTTLPVSRRPARWMSSSRIEAGMRYTVGLDELRPWRPVLLRDPVAVALDVGGDPDTVNAGIAVYAPRWGEPLGGAFTITGAARAFEATVSWRVRAAGGIVTSGFTQATLGTSEAWGAYETPVALPAGISGPIALEVYEISMRDGSELNLVRVPFGVR